MSQWVTDYKTPDLNKDRTLEIHKLNADKVKNFSSSLSRSNKNPSKVSTNVRIY